jgi:hypothetical protein
MLKREIGEIHLFFFGGEVGEGDQKQYFLEDKKLEEKFGREVG